MTRSFVLAAGLITAMAAGTMVHAQAHNSVDIRTSDQIRKQAAELLEQARKRADGVGTVTLEKYSNHLTMLTVRVKPGGAEMHAHTSDFFIVEEGEATVVTGGSIADAKVVAPGETRGSKVVGGQSRTVHAGDIVHISPNVPHQTIVTPGKIFTYYVIKVTEPEKK